MAFLRGFTRNRWLTVAVAALSYALVLQGLVAAFAKTAMAAETPGLVFVICAPSGTSHDGAGSPLRGIAGDCCSALCKAACAIGAGSEPLSGAFLILPLQAAAGQAARPSSKVGSASLRLLRRARAPPPLSV